MPELRGRDKRSRVQGQPCLHLRVYKPARAREREGGEKKGVGRREGERRERKPNKIFYVQNSFHKMVLNG
jgi:ribosomal protein L19E